MEYRILLVDDSDMQRYAIAKTLTSAGFQVLEAQNGTEALQKATQGMQTPEIRSVHQFHPRNIEHQLGGKLTYTSKRGTT
jgi:CheY-like chemotaxis protein